MFIKYTYNGNFGPWIPVPTEELQDLSYAELENRDAKFVTVLAIDEESDPPLYQGPFYLDVDAKKIAVAITATQNVIKKLLQGGVAKEAIRVWASGKKGFHLTIPANVFSEGAPHAELPLIYKEMAHTLSSSTAVDDSVYSMGKGRVWRVENIQRSDNHRYKVPLSVDEVLGITPETYAELTKEPRESQWEAAPPESSYLNSLFERARFQVAQRKVPEVALIDPEVEEKFGDSYPRCMEWLLEGKNIKKDVGFNHLSLQMAKATMYVAPGDIQKIASQFSKNAPGDSYNTAQRRRTHFMSACSQVRKQPERYAFNCNTMRSVLSEHPCEGCPLYDPETDISQDAVTKAENSETFNASVLLGLEETPNGYCFVAEKGERRLVTNFTLRFRKEYQEMSQSMKENRRVSIHADVFIEGNREGTVQLEETNWISKSAFLSAFVGIGNAAFFGSDNDVQKMKSALLSGENDMEQIIRVFSAGIHSKEVAGETIYTYVEPGWSIDSVGLENKMHLSGRVAAVPELKNVPEISEETLPKQADILRALLNTNSPEIVSQVVGWYSACFLKQHFEVDERQFPLLGLSGNAGSGKTVTATVMALLHGADYIKQDGPVTLSTVTEYALWSFISSSTTVPRILDEFNRSKMSKRQFNQISEMMKSVWSSQAVSRGTISGSQVHGRNRTGATTVEIPLCGPVVYISEQAQEMPALVDRTIQVQMSRESRAKPHMTRNMAYVQRNRNDLKPIARAMYMHSLVLEQKFIHDCMDEFGQVVPFSLGDRPYYSYCVVLTGLRYLAKVQALYNLGLDAELKFLEEKMIEQIQNSEEDVARSKQRSEVDIVLEKMGVMSALDQTATPWLASGKHFIRDEDTLYLDMPIAHAMYIKYVTTYERQAVAVESTQQFKMLLSQEPYCDSVSEVLADFANGRPVAKLNVHKLREKGVDVNLFPMEFV